MTRTIKQLSISNFRGRKLHQIIHCEYIHCENKAYIKGDNVTCFIHCLHSFHTHCIERQFGDKCQIECIFCKQDNLEEIPNDDIIYN
jgi:hypothetical protein